MLYHAFIACGALQQYMMDPISWPKVHHESHYKKSQETLEQSLVQARWSSQQGANVDLELPAVTSVVLSVYACMIQTKEQRWKVLSRTRQLIKECNWDATSVGPGGACFWLERGMELLTCLSPPTLKVPWDPDTWSLDMNYSFGEDTRRGMEYLWTHRIIYILSKVTNDLWNPMQSKGKVPPDSSDDPMELWHEYASLLRGWEDRIPPTMRPVWKILPGPTAYRPGGKNSNFPSIGLFGWTTYFARVFYHTAWILLAKTHPNLSRKNAMRDVWLENARCICGIAKHLEHR
jgi:hypothetical protein